MRRLHFGLLMLVFCLLTFESAAAQMAYPQVVRMRYEAVEPKGGSFVIWLDRERVHHGLDAKLYPPVRYVEITHLTPPGSPSITVIEVMSVNATVPEFYHVAGPARFKMMGMVVKSSNADGK
jgi:hypothetical protein